MASNELERAVQNSDSAVRQLQNALDLIERTIPYVSAFALETELAGLTENEVIVNGIDKERAQELIDFAASVGFYLRGMDDGTGNTLLGDTPKNASQLETAMIRLGV